ncbi:hypothetical protein MSAN_02250500 [Mycena sanguinolenta]|uniref:Ankyrin repeat protein n=1 Tax=Mycena sanguinolenta TaxID=230812 RepID=A0A8H7CJ16_9AGAR|nr:hypothetical protein MSAN_02250500 [Mycena sanguinolenta]
MGEFSELPPELVFHIASFLTRKIIIDKDGSWSHQEAELVPDLPSINALSQANTALHRLLDQVLYDLCASVEALARLALIFAVKHELEGTLDRLVAAGASLNVTYYRCGLLHLAAALGLTAMVVKLLEMPGGSLSAYACMGMCHMTALDYAARNGHMDIARILAPLPSPMSSVSHAEYLNCALSFSVLRGGNTDISLFLISEGANINSCCTTLGRTPLYYAVTMGKLELVQVLLSLGADPNGCCVCHGALPLTVAACRGNLAIARILVDAGADMHQAFQYCATLEVLHFFLERGADPNAEYPGGSTPLHKACMKQDVEFAKASVEVLLQFGAATVEKADRRGLTPVDIAIGRELNDIVRVFEPLVQNPDIKLRIQSGLPGRKRRF